MCTSQSERCITSGNVGNAKCRLQTSSCGISPQIGRHKRTPEREYIKNGNETGRVIYERTLTLVM